MMIEIKNLKNEKPSLPYDIIIDRRSAIGSPFILNNEEDRDLVCNQYEEWFNRMTENKDNVNFNYCLNDLINLYRKHGNLRLFCWCTPLRCHAETIKTYVEKQ